MANCGDSPRPAPNLPVNACQSTWVGGRPGTGYGHLTCAVCTCNEASYAHAVDTSVAGKEKV